MAGVYPFRNYRAFFTPLVGVNQYGNVIDVTQDIDLTDWLKDTGRIRRELDNGDYDIGIFTFADITITAINFDRRFNGPEDPRSIFKYKRDRCKVDIVFYDEDGNDTTRFKGLINDDATRLDFDKNTIRFKVLSLDSIFRQTFIQAGAIVSGDLFSTAIKKALNIPEITSTLTYSDSNVTVDLDLVIDDGEVFSSLPVKDALDELLLASNSILFLDDNDTIKVQPRQESANVFYLYGPGNLQGKENILSIRNFNPGLQRAFSSVKVGENAVATNDGWVLEYGFRQKEISFDFINTLAKEEAIAANILAAFQVPKDEIEVTIPTKDVLEIQLLDLVSIDYGYRYAPAQGEADLPFWGSFVWGASKWPYTAGAYKIPPNYKWKVIGIEEDLRKFVTTLKLRRTGTDLHDGMFT